MWGIKKSVFLCSLQSFYVKLSTINSTHVGENLCAA